MKSIRNSIRTLVVGLLSLSIGLAYGQHTQATDWDSIQQRLAEQSLIRGEFQQLRRMAMLNQPLTSEGSFLIYKGQTQANDSSQTIDSNGLLWQQKIPFPVTLVLTDDQLSQQIASQAKQVMTAKENPMAFYFSHIFLALFHGDADALDQQFSRLFSPGDEQWQLTLTPKKEPLNAVFSTITIQGNHYIEQITLTEKRGDVTQIQFFNQTQQPTTLSTDEQQHFQF